MCLMSVACGSASGTYGMSEEGACGESGKPEFKSCGEYGLPHTLRIDVMAETRARVLRCIGVDMIHPPRYLTEPREEKQGSWMVCNHILTRQQIPSCRKYYLERNVRSSICGAGEQKVARDKSCQGRRMYIM